jgi:hypothetical protein
LPCFRQKKRFVNTSLFQLLCSGVSLRRTARLLGINRKTVDRKLVFLAAQAELGVERFIERLLERRGSLDSLQFDEMETFERSKCLPLSIPLVVEPRSYAILGFGVARMPAKGPLAAISLKKYGRRIDERSAVAGVLLRKIAAISSEKVDIASDEKPVYPSWIRRAGFQSPRHRQYKGRRARVVGQGELKRGGFDPLFALNHSAAMVRANVSRLVRRTWATTKRPDRLQAHLWLYAHYHNQHLPSAA